MRGAPCRDIDLYEARANAARGPSRPLSSTLRIRSKIISFSEIIARGTKRTPLTTCNLPSSHRIRHAPPFKKRRFPDWNDGTHEPAEDFARSTVGGSRGYRLVILDDRLVERAFRTFRTTVWSLGT